MTSTPVKTSSTIEKKDVQKLQRAIIDGLEDVKAQDIQVFDTEHITSLFERVIVASGSSNRQTKALAASVRDAVRDAGFAKPRIEGEENGEWIIVDCGAAVAHIMQPTIRQYYHLEELWGEKPVKLKLGAPAPLAKAAKPEPKAEAKQTARPKAGAKSAAQPVVKSRAKPGAKSAARSAARPAVKSPVREYEAGYIGKLGKTSDWTARRNEAEPAAEPAARPVKTTRAPAKTVATKSAARPATRTVAARPTPKAARTPVVEVPVAKKVAARKVATKTATQSVSRPAAKKTAPRSR